VLEYYIVALLVHIRSLRVVKEDITIMDTSTFHHGRAEDGTRRTTEMIPKKDDTPNNDNKKKKSNDVLRLVTCAFGICVCYMYYGMVQESLFSRQKIGPSFVLLVQCITNSLVARLWQFLDAWWFAKDDDAKEGEDQNVAKYKKTDGDGTPPKQEQQDSTQKQQLHHPLLALTSLCYVSAMVCSNESLHYVTYPTAVLAKSCKLIPTMAMGVLVEHKSYAAIEWMAALCITMGIVMFNLSRLNNKHSSAGGEDKEQESIVGLILLSTSLLMDGFLGSCQGLLKQKTSLTVPSMFYNNNNKQPPKVIPIRAPNATETMLYVNLYAILVLIPLTIVNQQMQEGLAMLYGTAPSTYEEEHDMLNHTTTNPDTNHHRNLWTGLIVLNLAVAVGQIFIFLTITWYSSLVCTTITTTRKFFTILLSVLYFGHHFSITQWISTGLVFSGLYLGIMGQRANAASKSKSHPPAAALEPLVPVAESTKGPERSLTPSLISDKKSD